jgi:hypothetical protein
LHSLRGALEPGHGASLEGIVERQGNAIGELETEIERPTFRDLYRHEMESPRPKRAKPAVPRINATARLAGEIRLVIAGTAGERVFNPPPRCYAAPRWPLGLYSTQKNDNPVTQGSGFSLSEICLSPKPIEYTGMESPDVVLVVSEDGWKELQANGTLAACREETLLLVDSQIDAMLPSRSDDAAPAAPRSQSQARRAVRDGRLAGEESGAASGGVGSGAGCLNPRNAGWNRPPPWKLAGAWRAKSSHHHEE